MEPNLLIGDRLFVSKYTYGYSRHSFPFSPKIFKGRIFSNLPERGDIIVFKTPADNRTDYIKRLVGLPGDEIQIVNGEIFINKVAIKRLELKKSNKINCGNSIHASKIFTETLSNDISYVAAYSMHGSMINSDKYNVPNNHYFFMGDNRDCSKDSRYLASVGYVNFDNIVGKARIIFFSTDKNKGNFFEFWNWKKIIRFERFLKKIK